MSQPKSSRLIVRNVPKHFTEKRLTEHFEKIGRVTDCKIILKSKGKSRNFAFLGLKDVKDAEKAKEYFHNSFLDTSQVTVDFAFPQNSDHIPRPWSKYSKGSSAYILMHRAEQEHIEAEEKKRELQNAKKMEANKIQDKKEKYKKFLQSLASSNKQQSWNDVFTNIMEDDNSQPQIQQNSPKLPPKKIATKSKKVIKEIHQVEGSTVVTKDVSQLKPLKAGMKASSTHIKFGNKEEIDTDKIQKVIQNREQKINKGRTASINEEQQEKNERISEVKKEELDEKRIMIMNLSFEITEDELRSLCSKYGALESLHIPQDFQNNRKRGFAFVKYVDIESAVNAFGHLDQSIFQGRKLHVRPAAKQKLKKNEVKIFERTAGTYFQNKEIKEGKSESYERTQEKTSFHKKKIGEAKVNYEDETNWNYLFLNPNAVASAIASKLNIEKGELLSRDSDNLAVRLAQSETQLINETKQWLKDLELNLDFLNQPRKSVLRSDKTLFVKNIAFDCSAQQLKELFERYGKASISVSPSNTLAIVTYQNSLQTEIALRNLSYFKFKGLPLYLEKAPIGIKILEKSNSEMKEEEDQKIKYGKTIFVKNLNFQTSDDLLLNHFTSHYLKPVSLKIIREKNISKGYGFVEFNTPQQALEAIKKLQNTIIQDHALKLSLSQKKQSTKEINEKKMNLKRKRTTDLDNPFNDELISNKLIVKNVAFEANKNDLKQLFRTYGQVKKVRLPQLATGRHRGFGFIEFLTKEEAKNAFDMLQNTHLYGKKLVIQWAKADSTSIQQIIQKTEKKYQSLIDENPSGTQQLKKGILQKKKKMSKDN